MGVTLLVVLFVIVAGFFYWRSGHDTSDTPVTVDAQPPVVSKSQNESPAAKPARPGALASTKAQMAAELEERYGELYRAQNKPFVLYGIVEDTNGAPITNATVSVQLVNYGIFTQEDDVERRYSESAATDSAGRFEIEGRAASVRIRIEKDGYVFDRNSQAVLQLSQFDENQMQALGTRSNPRRYLGWQATTVAQPQDIVSGRYRAYLKPDGRPQPVQIPGTDLVLTIIMSTDFAASYSEPGGWSTALSIANGRIQRAAPGLLMEAPQDGYQPDWAASYAKGDAAWSDFKAHSFYVAYGRGPKFASLTIEWQPYFDKNGDAMAKIDYRINNAGSRVLATKDDLRP